MLIIGGGMIASAFKDCCVRHDELLVFASGVSNSTESDSLQFAREAALLSETISKHSNRKVIYFSSCAIGFVDTPYYRHKLAMEKRIQHTAARFLICRLPQVVGLATNATLVSQLVRSIRNNAVITVIADAKRNLIDVEDVVRIVLRLVHQPNMTIQVTNGKIICVEDLISDLSAILGVSPLIAYGEREARSVTYDASKIRNFLDPSDRIFADGYSRDVLRKYVPRMI